MLRAEEFDPKMLHHPTPPGGLPADRKGGRREEGKDDGPEVQEEGHPVADKDHEAEGLGRGPQEAAHEGFGQADHVTFCPIQAEPEGAPSRDAALFLVRQIPRSRNQQSNVQPPEPRSPHETLTLNDPRTPRRLPRGPNLGRNPARSPDRMDQLYTVGLDDLATAPDHALRLGNQPVVGRSLFATSLWCRLV